MPQHPPNPTLQRRGDPAPDWYVLLTFNLRQTYGRPPEPPAPARFDRLLGRLGDLAGAEDLRL